MSLSKNITDGGHRRGWSAPEKLRIVEEGLDSRETITRRSRQGFDRGPGAQTGKEPSMRYRRLPMSAPFSG